MLAVLAAMGVRYYAFVAYRWRCLLLHVLPLGRGAPDVAHSAGRALVKTTFYAVIAVLAVARWYPGDQGEYAQLLAECFLVRSPTRSYNPSGDHGDRHGGRAQVSGLQ